MKINLKRISKRSLALILGILMLFSTLMVGSITAHALDVTNGYYYFDNTNTNWSNVAMAVGHETWKCSYPLTKISGTNIWYYYLTSTWGGANGYYFYNGNTSEGGTGSNYYDYYNSVSAENRTAKIETANNGKIIIPSSSGSSN